MKLSLVIMSELKPLMKVEPVMKNSLPLMLTILAKINLMVLLLPFKEPIGIILQ